VATIQHKVETPYLVEPYGRQLLTPVEGPVYALPPLLDARLGGHEVSIELRTSADAAAYLCYRHRPRASIGPSHCCTRDHFEIIEAEQQPIRDIVSSQADPHLPKPRPSKGAGEVRLYQIFKAHITAIGHTLSSGKRSTKFELARKQRARRPAASPRRSLGSPITLIVSFVAFCGAPEARCHALSCSNVVCSYLANRLAPFRT
jgi:hypothetical protein